MVFRINGDPAITAVSSSVHSQDEIETCSKGDPVQSNVLPSALAHFNMHLERLRWSGKDQDGENDGVSDQRFSGIFGLSVLGSYAKRDLTSSIGKPVQGSVSFSALALFDMNFASLQRRGKARGKA